MIVDFRFLIEEEEFFTISNLQSPISNLQSPISIVFGNPSKRGAHEERLPDLYRQRVVVPWRDLLGGGVLAPSSARYEH